jgi:hypothetical protein
MDGNNKGKIRAAVHRPGQPALEAISTTSQYIVVQFPLLDTRRNVKESTFDIARTVSRVGFD